MNKLIELHAIPYIGEDKAILYVTLRGYENIPLDVKHILIQKYGDLYACEFDKFYDGTPYTRITFNLQKSCREIIDSLHSIASELQSSGYVGKVAISDINGSYYTFGNMHDYKY